MSRDASGLPPAALGQSQNPGHPPLLNVLPTLTRPLLLMGRDALSYVFDASSLGTALGVSDQ